jgi:hypothetical protein
MSSPQFDEFRLVSYHEHKQFITDTSYGILLYVSIVSIPPSFIETKLNFKLSVSFLTTDLSDGIDTKVILPSKPNDIPIISKITLSDGTTNILTKTINQLDIFPIKHIEGHLYFETNKTAKQFPTTHKLEIIKI